MGIDNHNTSYNNKIDMDPISSLMSAGKRILLVEDEKDYRSVLAERLKEEGFSILEAEDGEIALEIVKNNDVDLIVLDMLMPKMDGITFFYHLRNDLKKDTRVIILTNFSETAYPQGIADFVVKSEVSLEEVVQKIKNNLPVKL